MNHESIGAQALMPRWLMLIGILIIVALGAVYFGSDNRPTLGLPQKTAIPAVPKNVPKTVGVVYRNHAFEPPAAQIVLGQSILFQNLSDQPIWVASDPYPTHADLPALNSGKQIPPGQSYSFTFPRVGIFGYHNELIPTEQGKVTISEAP